MSSNLRPIWLRIIASRKAEKAALELMSECRRRPDLSHLMAGAEDDYEFARKSRLSDLHRIRTELDARWMEEVGDRMRTRLDAVDVVLGEMANA